jgi:membrane carboxypeptidase/penicillin-binding protein
VEVLQGVLTVGTGRQSAAYGVAGSAGGKTGTTDDYRDAWFVGFTPELAVAVWVGRDQGTLGLTGSKAALPTWSRFVAASGTQDSAFPEAQGMLAVALCDATGLVARDDCEDTHRDLFVSGTAPRKKCDVHGAPKVRPARVLGGLFGNRD